MVQLKVSLDCKIKNKIEFCNISIQLVQVVIEQELAMSPRNVTFLESLHEQRLLGFYVLN